MSNIIEQWKPVPGYEELYEVSNRGNIRSLDRYVRSKHEGYFAFIKGKNLVPIKNQHGYLRVNLCNAQGRKAKFVHRLVCLAFLPNPNNYPHINHKDENPLNNNLENLEWCTPKYNCNYGNHCKNVSLATTGIKKHYTKETKERIKAASSRAVIGTNIQTGEEIYFSAIVDCQQFGFTVNGVSHCVTHRQNTHKGYTWRYANICQPQTI